MSWLSYGEIRSARSWTREDFGLIWIFELKMTKCSLAFGPGLRTLWVDAYEFQLYFYFVVVMIYLYDGEIWYEIVEFCV